MSNLSPIEWIDYLIKRLQAQLKEFEELRQKMIDDPEMDTKASEAAAAKIAGNMPDQ